jgi:hypothetical protein
MFAITYLKRHVTADYKKTHNLITNIPKNLQEKHKRTLYKHAIPSRNLSLPAAGTQSREYYFG